MARVAERTEAEPDRPATTPRSQPDAGGTGAARLMARLATADGATRARAVAKLQRTHGNAYVQRLVADKAQARCACGGIAGPDGECEACRAKRLAKQHVSRAPAVRVLQRYSHDDCSEEDLRNHIWPADYIARQMVKKAIRVLSATPVDPRLTPLFTKYFMTSTPSRPAMLRIYDKIDAEFRANDYQYECDEDCSGTELGHVYGIWSDIHVCLNHLRGKANECIARTIVHEFSHYYAGTDDNGYCKSGCSYSSCPTSLTADDALENADSYACFAYELYPMLI